MKERFTRQSLGRLAAEALSVTAGVLLAFAVDAMWARAQEQEVVEGLRLAAAVEASANRELLGVYRDAGARSLGAARQLINIISPEPPEVSADSMLTLMGALLTYNAAPLEFAATDRLLASGDLEALLDPEFHRSLLSLRSAATRYENQGERFERIHEELVLEFGRVAPLAILSASKPGLHPPSDFPIDLGSVLRSHNLEGAVGNLAVWVDNLNRRVDQLMLLSDSVWVD